MNIAVIDNYDSFVYNLVHNLYSLGATHIDIMKNDRINMESIMNYDKILLSPGPGVPTDAHGMMDVIDYFHSKKSILGVCLGHQAIGEYFGGTIRNLDFPLHGISSPLIINQNHYIFDGIENKTDIAHYHSWVVNKNLPNELEILAKDQKDNIMAIAHQQYDVIGLQFHPESILTSSGNQILSNWLNHKI